MNSSNQYFLNNLARERDKIDEMIRNCQSQSQQPVNNFINAGQQAPQKDVVEWRILNENEEVDNLYVQNNTLFIGDDLMIKKSVDGTLQKWKIKKIYPIDKKDEKINQLEEEIRKLKEMINSEHSKFSEPVKDVNKSDGNDDGVVEPKPKTSSKSISK